MKKIDDMAISWLHQFEHQVFDPPVNTSITCGCCSELPTIQSVTRRKGVDNEYDEEEHDTATIKRRGSCLVINRS